MFRITSIDMSAHCLSIAALKSSLHFTGTLCISQRSTTTYYFNGGCFRMRARQSLLLLRFLHTGRLGFRCCHACFMLSIKCRPWEQCASFQKNTLSHPTTDTVKAINQGGRTATAEPPKKYRERS